MTAKQFENIVPRTEFLAIRAKHLEEKLIEWCKRKHYSQGDSYQVNIDDRGRWSVGYSNDYPLQHGSGEKFILTEQDFFEATTLPFSQWRTP